tara:strand:- start:26 stop:481 length:456 start_codon:yes stop_codon:yes gene_type:complete
MLPKECYHCKKNCYDIYVNDINNKKNLLINLFKILNEDIIKNICEFIFHKKHQVTFRRKSGNYVNSGFYWTEVMVLCSKCFHKGIMISILRNNDLPRLRGDINNFLIEDYNKEKKTIDKYYGKNFYPEVFSLSVSRSFFIFKNGTYYVSVK